MTTVSPPSFTNLSYPDREDCHYLEEYYVWRKGYLTEHTFRSLIASAFFNCVAIIPTILLNALVIFAVATRRRLRSNSNVLGVFGGSRFAGWTGCSTNCYRGRSEGSFWHRTILYTGKGIQRKSFWASLGFVQSSLVNQHASIATLQSRIPWGTGKLLQNRG